MSWGLSKDKATLQVKLWISSLYVVAHIKYSVYCHQANDLITREYGNTRGCEEAFFQLDNVAIQTVEDLGNLTPWVHRYDMLGTRFSSATSRSLVKACVLFDNSFLS